LQQRTDEDEEIGWGIVSAIPSIADTAQKSFLAEEDCSTDETESNQLPALDLISVEHIGLICFK
jgi:hypothetical protein